MQLRLLTVPKPNFIFSPNILYVLDLVNSYREAWIACLHQILGKIPGCYVLHWAIFNSPTVTKFVQI
jgi:hypothetical protein